MKANTVNVKKHYDTHLANFYSWMLGDLKPKIDEFQNFLKQNKISPGQSKNAIDLGAGNRIQSIALKNLGFNVTALDFNRQLLNELNVNPNATGIQTMELDITKVSELKQLNPDLITCCGDTITHLEDKKEIAKLIADSTKILTKNGHLILTFRDYSKALNDQQRFIPVKSSSKRILTCILEYSEEKVTVTDLLHEKVDTEWVQKVSSYKKVRIAPQEIVCSAPVNRMQTVIAKKRHSTIDMIFTVTNHS